MTSRKADRQMRSRSPRRYTPTGRSGTRAWQRQHGDHPLQAALLQFANFVSPEQPKLGHHAVMARVHCFDADIAELAESSEDSHLSARHLDLIIKAVATPLGTFDGNDTTTQDVTKELIRCIADGISRLNSLKKQLQLCNIPVLFHALRSHAPCEETLALLRALSKQLQMSSEGRLSAWQLAMIMCGIKLHPEQSTTNSIVASVTRQIRFRCFKFQELAIRYILLGLENLNPSDTSRGFLEAFMAQNFDHLHNVEFNTVVNALQCLRNLSCVIPALQMIQMLHSKVSSKTCGVKVAVTGLLELQEYPCIQPTADILGVLVQVVVEKEKYIPSPEDMCGVLCGLYQHPTTAHSIKLMQKVEKWLSESNRDTHIAESVCQISPAVLSAAIWGLANQQSTRESHSLLKILSGFTKYSLGRWTKKNILHALHGLRYQKEGPEVREWLNFLMSQIAAMTGDGDDAFSLNEFAIATRTKAMSSYQLFIMLEKVEKICEPLSAEVLTSLLPNFTVQDDSPVCDEILLLLARHVDRCKVAIHKNDQIGNLLFTFKDMSPSKGSCQILQILLPCILEKALEQADDKISPPAVARALVGLRHHHQLGQQYFQGLLRMIQISLRNPHPSDYLTSDEFQMALRVLGDRIEDEPFLAVFVSLLESVARSPGHLTDADISDALSGMKLHVDWHLLGFLVYGLRECEKSDSNVAVLKCLNDMLDRKAGPLSKNDVARFIEGLEYHGTSEASSSILSSIGKYMLDEFRKPPDSRISKETVDDESPLEDLNFEDILKYLKGFRNHTSTPGTDHFLKSLAFVMFALKMSITLDQATQLFIELSPLKFSKGVKCFVGMVKRQLVAEQAFSAEAENRAVQALQGLR